MGVWGLFMQDPGPFAYAAGFSDQGGRRFARVKSVFSFLFASLNLSTPLISAGLLLFISTGPSRLKAQVYQHKSKARHAPHLPCGP